MKKIKAKQIIMKELTNALIDHQEELKESFQSNLTKIASITKPEAEKMFLKINNQYYEAINNQVISELDKISPGFLENLKKVHQNINLKKDEEEKLSEGYGADRLFSICFYILTGKKAPKRHCAAAKQLQSFAMQDVLKQVHTKMNRE